MRLTDKQKAEVVTDFRAFKSKSEIAKKFNISVTAVSKILKSYESSKSLEKFNKVHPTKTQKEMSNEIVEKATVALLDKDFNKMCPETLVKIIERMTFVHKDMQGDPKGELQAIVERIKEVPKQ